MKMAKLAIWGQIHFSPIKIKSTKKSAKKFLCKFAVVVEVSIFSMTYYTSLYQSPKFDPVFFFFVHNSI